MSDEYDNEDDVVGNDESEDFNEPEDEELDDDVLDNDVSDDVLDDDVEIVEEEVVEEYDDGNDYVEEDENALAPTIDWWGGRFSN